MMWLVGTRCYKPISESKSRTINKLNNTFFVTLQENIFAICQTKYQQCAVNNMQSFFTLQSFHSFGSCDSALNITVQITFTRAPSILANGNN
jgi:hypothetical protein